MTPTKVEVFASCETNVDFVSFCIMWKLFGFKAVRHLIPLLNLGNAGIDIWSHVGWLVTYSDGSVRVYDATGVGISYSSLESLLVDHTLPRRIDVTHKVQGVTLDYFQGWLDGRCGTEYSWSQYLLFLLPGWAKRTAFFFTNGKEKSVCSEFVADGCVVANIISSHLFPNPDKVDPRQIIEALEVVTLPRGRAL